MFPGLIFLVCACLKNAVPKRKEDWVWLDLALNKIVDVGLNARFFLLKTKCLPTKHIYIVFIEFAKFLRKANDILTPNVMLSLIMPSRE